jgi:hypothetical protein
MEMPRADDGAKVRNGGGLGERSASIGAARRRVEDKGSAPKRLRGGCAAAAPLSPTRSGRLEFAGGPQVERAGPAHGGISNQ